MPIFLAALWGKTKYYILAGLAGLLALITLYFKIKQSGKNEVREEIRENTDKVVDFEAQDRQQSDAMSNDELRNSVRSERDRVLSGK